MERSAGKRRAVQGRTVLMAIAGAVALAGCGTGLQTEQDFPRKEGGVYRTDSYWEKQKNNTIFGADGGFDLFGGGKKNGGEGGGGIGVNSFLWRATLDTIAFMPLASADPFGGVIITDWYSPPEAPQERYKMSVYILGRELRADGVKVAVFRQRHDSGSWTEATVTKDTAANLENQILTRARQLRVVATQAR